MNYFQGRRRREGHAKRIVLKSISNEKGMNDL